MEYVVYCKKKKSLTEVLTLSYLLHLGVSDKKLVCCIENALGKCDKSSKYHSFLVVTEIMS